jgi:hypothetical protein
MKKIILLAIIALTIHAFAQDRHSMFNMYHPASIPMKHFTGISEDTEGSSSHLFPQKNLLSDLKHQTPEPLGFIQLMDSIVYWEWNMSSKGWILDRKAINYVYDAAHNPLGFEYQTWNGSAWENYLKLSIAYDASNNPLSFLVQTWNGSAWENYSLYTYAYDSNNIMLSELYQSWYGSA